MRELTVEEAEAIMAKHGIKVPYHVGVMMELPRACLMADKIAQHAEFFSFGTNDLTQTTLGYSRDDAAKFIKKYIERGVVCEGAGRMVVGAAMRDKAAKKMIDSASGSVRT